MKKILSFAIGLVFLLSITGCSQTENYDMSIKPSEFSEETLKVLELFDDELQFFDIKVDETAKSHSLSVWVYRDGEWHEDGNTFGEIDFLSNQIAIELTKDSYELFSIDDSGHTSYSYPVIETDFENSMGIGGSRIDREIPIELNKEIPIWVKIGTEDGSMEVMDITEDFRKSDCNAGIVVTLTISDEVVE